MTVIGRFLSKFSITFFLCAVNPTVSKFMRNRYKIDVESVETCPDNNQMESPIKNLKFSRINRTHKALSYDVNFVRSLDANVGMNMLMQKWGDGGWITIPFNPFQADMCRYSKTYFRQVWFNYLRALGAKEPEKCPIPPGNYSMKNYLFDLSSITIPFWSGRFRATSTAMTVDTRKGIYCLMTTVSINELF